MSNLTRRIILYGLILFFAIASPSVILYAMGYNFDFEEKKLVLAGGFYFSSMLKGAEVYVDGQLGGETPVFIKRLLPKTYQVKIDKEGYQSWEKNLKVQSMLVTDAKNILLIPTNPVIETASSTLAKNFSLEDFLSDQVANYTYYIQKPTYILYKKTAQDSSLGEQVSLAPLPEDHKYRIIASNNSKGIAAIDETGRLFVFNPLAKNFVEITNGVKDVQFASDNRKLLYLTPFEIWVCHLNFSNDPDQEQISCDSITRLSQKITNAAWYSKTNEHIIFTTDSRLKIIELDSRDKRNIFDITAIKNIEEIAYNLADDKIYLTRNGKLLTVDISGA